MQRRITMRSFKRKKPTEYCYIQDFENTNEKTCKRCDKDNNLIYERNSTLYIKTKKYLEKNNAIFKMEGPPDPPRVPSNYELYVIHQKRNSHTNNKIQTIAILYLLNREYKLIIDPDIETIPKVLNKENKLFEPYMAIDIASSLNKDFMNDVSKIYQFNGRILENPELLSLEDKIDRFNNSFNSFSNLMNEAKSNKSTIIISPSVSPPPPQSTPSPPMSAPMSAHMSAPTPSAPPAPIAITPNYVPPNSQNKRQSVNVPSLYPSLSLETEPPAYCSDGRRASYDSNHISHDNHNNENGKINIIINK